jgi:hypothetical protein
MARNMTLYTSQSSADSLADVNVDWIITATTMPFKNLTIPVVVNEEDYDIKPMEIPSLFHVNRKRRK